MPENNAEKRNDFTTNNFIQRNQHNRDINGIKKRLDDLELLVGTKEKFVSTLVAVCSDSTQVNEAIAKSVDSHDNHKIKLTFFSASKFLLNAAVGAFVAWLVIQAILIPQYNLKIDSLQEELNEVRKIQP